MHQFLCFQATRLSRYVRSLQNFWYHVVPFFLFKLVLPKVTRSCEAKRKACEAVLFYGFVPQKNIPHGWC